MGRQVMVVAFDRIGTPRAWATGRTQDEAVEFCRAQAQEYVKDRRSHGEHVLLSLATTGIGMPRTDLGVTVPPRRIR